MGIEIERKFLLKNDRWKTLAQPGVRYVQGYLSKDERRVVRIRVAGHQAFITVKSKSAPGSIARSEYEYSIPVDDAREMLQNLCQPPLIEKTRYKIPYKGLVWEVDVFEGLNQGLTIAEVELTDENQLVEIPDWVGEEVTKVSKYFNSNLASNPITSKPDMQLLDGKKYSKEILDELALEVKNIKAAGGKVPHLAAILVGNDGASETYVASKVRNCEAVGFESTLIRLPETISQDELLATVKKLNADSSVDGYIVQLPLPKHFDEKKIIEAIDPAKDVDGFHPVNAGRMALNMPSYLPATPFGILEMIRRAGIETAGKHCVVMGRSHIVGSPMSILMARNTYPGNCTVTICHSKTPNAEKYTREADILIVAVGKPEFLKADMVKPGAVVIDVGIHRIPDAGKKSGFKLVGDVAFDEVAHLCAYISPVPGGVGLMTISGLLMNTLKAAKKEIYA